MWAAVVNRDGEICAFATSNHNLSHRDHILLDNEERISYTVRLEFLAMGR